MTRDDIIRMALEAKFYESELEEWDHIERFAKLVAAAEREECAKVCDGAVGSASMYDSPDSAKFAYGIKNHCQELIRERGAP
jgi:hypothetical protein